MQRTLVALALALVFALAAQAALGGGDEDGERAPAASAAAAPDPLRPLARLAPSPSEIAAAADPLRPLERLAPARSDGAAAPERGEAPAARRRSRAIGKPYAGRLAGGVRLPAESELHFTWDPTLGRSPSRGWRRHGTDRLVQTIERVLYEFEAANPLAPRIGIGDLSRPRGGDFGPRFGGLGHASHQNGLDVDVYYPRRDGRERPPRSPDQIDRRLAQELVDAFVAAGAEIVFVGPRTGLRGPRGVVRELVHHDDHLHVRLPAR